MNSMDMKYKHRTKIDMLNIAMNILIYKIELLVTQVDDAKSSANPGLHSQNPDGTIIFTITSITAPITLYTLQIAVNNIMIWALTLSTS